MTEYRSYYDSVILREMLRKDKHGEYSFTDIYNIVRKRGRVKGEKKAPGKNTVQSHLNRMVEGKTLMRHKGHNVFNRTLYTLSPHAKSLGGKYLKHLDAIRDGTYKPKRTYLTSESFLSKLKADQGLV